MKQQEKLDLILRALYEKRDDGYLYPIEMLMKENDIPFSGQREINRLEQRLIDERLVRHQFNAGSPYRHTISGLGVDFVENNSFTSALNKSILNTTNVLVVNSPNTSVKTANKVVLNTFDPQEFRRQFELIIAKLSELEKISQENLNSLNELAEAILKSPSNDQYKTEFLSILGNAASIAGLIIPFVDQFFQT